MVCMVFGMVLYVGSCFMVWYGMVPTPYTIPLCTKNEERERGNTTWWNGHTRAEEEDDIAHAQE